MKIQRLLVSLFAAVCASAGDWPQWRGPDRTGAAEVASLEKNKTFGFEVVWKRELGSGYAQITVAGTTGVSVSQLSSIERGTHLPSMESMLALCQAFEIKPSDLLLSIDF